MCSFFKWNDELQVVFAIEISHWVENDEIETGRGANQIGTLVILDGVLISFQFVVFYACITISVLEDLAVKGSTFAQ